MLFCFPKLGELIYSTFKRKVFTVAVVRFEGILGVKCLSCPVMAGFSRNWC